MSFAKVTIVGRLGNDPETKYTQNGTLILSFSMAADGRRRGGGSGENQSNTTWFRVSAFAEQADRLATMVERGYIAKGRMLYVEGQLEARPYTGNDGKERTSLDVTLSDWQFIGSGQQDGQRNQGGDFNNNQGGNFGGNQGGGYGGGRNDRNQDSGNQYGGSNYGNEFPSGDEPSDLNDVPF